MYTNDDLNTPLVRLIRWHREQIERSDQQNAFHLRELARIRLADIRLRAAPK